VQRNRQIIQANARWIKNMNNKFNFMKNQISSFLSKQNSRLNSVCVILILLAAVLGCSDSNPSAESAKKSVPPAYVGIWTAADGSTVTIRNDSSGDYKSGGKTVEGATVEVDEAAKELRFALFGFDAGKYKIDQPPTGNKMKLDGMEYRRTGGFAVSDTENKTTDSKTGEAPSESEMRPVVAETMRNFDLAIQSGDFGDFHSTISEMWQNQITADELKKAFATTIAQKNDFKLKDEQDATISSKPVLKDEGDTLEVNGAYETTKNKNVRFRLKYIKENDEWKLLGIRLNP
jgi:hypothetical protein